MVPPTVPALPVDGDLAVVGPMARSARDLGLLLDVTAGPDPLALGVAYGMTLPPARHERLGDFRVLVLDEHPLLPTGAAVRAGVERVAKALPDGGARVERHSALLPDLAEAARLYMQLLASGSTVHFPVEAYEEVRAHAAGLGADDLSLDAARLRGMVLSHRDWLAANHLREAHRQGWRRFFAEFDAVVCMGRGGSGSWKPQEEGDVPPFRSASPTEVTVGRSGELNVFACPDEPGHPHRWCVQ